MADWEWISALYFFTIVRRTRSRSSRDQSSSKSPETVCIHPLVPSKTSRGPVIPRMARNAARRPLNAVFGAASPFQWERAPVRVTRRAMFDAPEIPRAWAMRTAPSPNAFPHPAAAANAPWVVWSNPRCRTGATSLSRHCTW